MIGKEETEEEKPVLNIINDTRYDTPNIAILSIAVFLNFFSFLIGQ